VPVESRKAVYVVVFIRSPTDQNNTPPRSEKTALYFVDPDWAVLAVKTKVIVFLVCEGIPVIGTQMTWIGRAAGIE
jgi:hypothetical protein